jgi:predicted permease
VKPATIDRLQAALLYLYPPAFRLEHGREMRQFVRAAAARDGGRALIVRLLLDLTCAVPREWIHTLRVRRRMPRADRARGSREPMKTTLHDLRYALRLLGKSPGFTAAAIVTLALGIGANTAIYTLADATLLRPVKVADPDRLVVFSWSSSVPDFREYQARDDVFSGTTASGGASRMSITVDGTSELAVGLFASGNLFDVLGVSPAHGRLLQQADDAPGAPTVAVLSHAYWQSRFGADPAAVGRLVSINGVAATIVGVAPAWFRGVSLFSSPAVYLPVSSSDQIRTGAFFARAKALTNRGFVWLRVMGRLREGVAVGQAEAALGAQYQQQHPPSPGRSPEKLRLTPLSTTALGGDAAAVRRFVMLLAGVVSLTLLIGCANIANLLLARAAARRREIGLRLALGASRSRIARQMLTESLVLASLGGAAATLVAYATLRLITVFQLPGGIPIAGLDLAIDRTALAATGALSIATGLLFGVTPALRAAGADLVASLRDASRFATGRGRTRAGLVAIQVALSLVLLIGSGLFLRSLLNGVRTPLGFTPDSVVTASVNLALARYPDARAAAFYPAAVERVRALPGVTAAAWTSILPTVGEMMWSTEVEGYAPPPGEHATVHASHVGAEYFRTLGTRVTAGREFEAADAAGQPIAVINETMARRYWSGRGPIGGRVKFFDRWLTVVGVVEDTKVAELDEAPVPFVYLMFDQWLTGKQSIATDMAHLFVRTGDGDQQLVPLVREQLLALDAQLPLYFVRPFEEIVGNLVMPQRMGATLFGIFSVLALTLAAVGIYGVASYVAALRTREMGIRVALGAARADIRTLVLRQGLTPVWVGIAGGLLLAYWAGRAATTFLYGVSATDPLTFGAVVLLLAVIALGATYAPARRAAAVDPVRALRYE